MTDEPIDDQVAEFIKARRPDATPEEIANLGRVAQFLEGLAPEKKEELHDLLQALVGRKGPPQPDVDVSEEPRPRSALDAMGDYQPEEWQGIIASVAQRCWESHPHHARSQAFFNGLSERLWDVDHEAAVQIDQSAVPVLLAGALSFGALLGFGLARTWPEGPEGFDGWAERAWAYADFDAVSTAWLLSDLQGDAWATS